MSIILKGIDLPKEGELTFIAVCNDGRAYKMAMPPTGVLRLGPYADLYQAIQIPTPHGRLIDASELIKSYMKGTKAGIDDFYDTIDIIDNAPTILEAEE